MTTATSGIDLPDSLSGWVEDTTGRRVTAAARHFAGASREAWTIDVEAASPSAATADDGKSPGSLFLLRDRGKGEGSARDAAVLRALEATSIPVPRVHGYDAERGAILLERVSGRSDFPAIEDDSEREATAHHLMELTGALHRLDPAGLEIPHLALPEAPEDCARPALVAARGALSALGAAADPFFDFALGWLEANVPRQVTRYSLVHSDMGPGNFLFEGRRVTGIVDWEVAHFGDPMEDLAALAVRDMATPVGSLTRRFAEYATSSGISVALDRVHYYRALVLVRNSLMIGLGLSAPPPGFDVVEMTMYQTLLMRAAALVLCDNLGVARPTAASALPDLGPTGTSSARATLIEGLRRDFEQGIRPTLEDPEANRLGDRLVRGLAGLEHDERIGAYLDTRECEDLGALFGEGRSPAEAGPERIRLEARLRACSSGGMSAAHETPDLESLACYFARRLHRLAERRRPLMGMLADRLPQPLEET